MIECPPFISNSFVFNLFLDFMSVVSFIINGLTIYCIIFKSTVHMQIYRWFLLYHQIITFASDISVSCTRLSKKSQVSIFMKPMILFPFAGGYPKGILQEVISTKCLVWIFAFQIQLTIASIIQLFFYRYRAAKGSVTIFSASDILLMFIFYCMCLICPLLIVTYKDNVSLVLTEIRKVSRKVQG